MNIIEIINKKYKYADLSIKIKAPVLGLISCISLVLMIMLIILNNLAKKSFLENINIYTITLGVTVSIYYLLGGSYNRAAIIFSFGIFISLTIGIFFESVGVIQSIYKNALNYILLFVLAGVINIKLKTLVLVISLSICGYIISTIFLISNIYPDNITFSLQLLPPVTVITAVGVLICFTKLFEINLINKIKYQLLSTIEEEHKNILDDTDVFNFSEIHNSERTKNSNRAKNVKMQIDLIQDKFIRSNIVLHNMSSKISDLQDFANEQCFNVNETSAAIELMSTNILNVSNVINKTRVTVDPFFDSSTCNEKSFDSVFSSFEDIIENFKKIKELTTEIDNIASQTNLLSMNAAIEAANAGDKGKGFVVVAEDIRKLAEISSNNAKEIGNTLIDLVKSIEITGSEVKQSGKSFHYIHNEIIEVSKAMEEISSSAYELSESSSEILTATSLLNSLTNKVQTLEDKVALIGHKPLSIDSYKLTCKELEILKLLCLTNGSNSDLAQELNISHGTIKQHLNNIFQKVGVRKRIHLIVLFRNNFV